MKKEDLPRPGSALEAELALQMKADKLPPPLKEYRFHSARKWRFDFAWPDQLFAVEVEGITYDGGRHQRVEGFENDLEKYQAAMLIGWTVYRVSRKQIKNLDALHTIATMLECAAEMAEQRLQDIKEPQQNYVRQS